MSRVNFHGISTIFMVFVSSLLFNAPAGFAVAGFEAEGEQEEAAAAWDGVTAVWQVGQIPCWQIVGYVFLLSPAILRQSILVWTLY